MYGRYFSLFVFLLFRFIRNILFHRHCSLSIFSVAFFPLFLILHRFLCHIPTFYRFWSIPAHSLVFVAVIAGVAGCFSFVLHLISYTAIIVLGMFFLFLLLLWLLPHHFFLTNSSYFYILWTMLTSNLKWKTEGKEVKEDMHTKISNVRMRSEKARRHQRKRLKHCTRQYQQTPQVERWNIPNECICNI